jgi:hypothetical protein
MRPVAFSPNQCEYGTGIFDRCVLLFRSRYMGQSMSFVRKASYVTLSCDCEIYEMKRSVSLALIISCLHPCCAMTTFPLRDGLGPRNRANRWV